MVFVDSGFKQKTSSKLEGDLSLVNVWHLYIHLYSFKISSEGNISDIPNP